MNATTIIIIVVVGFVVWKYVLPKLKVGNIFGTSGGIGQPGEAGGVGVSGADGADANGVAGDVQSMIDSISKQAGGGTGSHTTVCTNGTCQHFGGDNVRVSCINGKCRSNAAYRANFAYRV